MNQKGFTLMGQIVAIGLAVLGMGIVAPMLLSHFADGKTAALGETLNNANVAFQSYYVDAEGLIGDTLDANGNVVDGTTYLPDGDYFQELVAAGFMSRIPNDGVITFTIKKDTDSTAYYVNGAYAAESVDAVEARIKDLNSKIDKMDATGQEANDGILHWTPGAQGTSGGSFQFLLYGEQVDINDPAWHS